MKSMIIKDISIWEGFSFLGGGKREVGEGVFNIVLVFHDILKSYLSHIGNFSYTLWTSCYHGKKAHTYNIAEGIRTSYLVHTFLEAIAISDISCRYGYLVTMATEAGTYNIAV